MRRRLLLLLLLLLVRLLLLQVLLDSLRLHTYHRYRRRRRRHKQSPVSSLLLPSQVARANPPRDLLRLIDADIPAALAVGETFILLHPPLPFVGVSIEKNRGVSRMTVSPTARLLRPLRTVNRLPGLRRLVTTLLAAVPHLGSLFTTQVTLGLVTLGCGHLRHAPQVMRPCTWIVDQRG